MKKLNVKLVPVHSFTTRVQTLFSIIFTYHFTRKPIYSERKTMFGNYRSMVFRKAGESPILQLLKKELIGEFESVEILVKDKRNQEIDDTDLESVTMSVREKSDRLYILATSHDVPSDDYHRIFRAFTRHQIVILPLGEKDITELEKFVKNDNINGLSSHPHHPSQPYYRRRETLWLLCYES